jgi:hypothetical protein
MHVLLRALALKLIQERGLLGRPGSDYRKRILRTNHINHSSYADLTMTYVALVWSGTTHMHTLNARRKTCFRMTTALSRYGAEINNPFNLVNSRFFLTARDELLYAQATRIQE